MYKPSQPVLIYLFFVLMLSQASANAYLTVTYQLAGLPRVVLWLLLLGGTVSTLGTAGFLRFFLKSPQHSRLLKRIPSLGYLVYVPYVFLMLPYALLTYYSWVFSPEELHSFPQSHPILAASYNCTIIAYIVTGMLLLVFSYKRLGRPERTKVRVILAAFIVGVVPFMLWNFSPLIVGLGRLNQGLVQWYLFFALAALLLLPISFSYAVVRHQGIPVTAIFRRSIRYLLVARGFIVVESLVAFFTLTILLNTQRAVFLSQFGRKIPLMLEVVVAAVLILCWRRVHQRVRPLIDKHFLRGPYDVQTILSELGRIFVAERDNVQLLRLVALKIQETLHAERVSGWALDKASGGYVCVFSLSHASGSGPVSDKQVDEEQAPRLLLPKGSLTIEMMSESKGPLAVDFPNPQSWVHSRLKGAHKASEVRMAEHASLEAVGAVIMLPFVMKDRLQYVIALGHRLNDLPYSREDEQMLSSVIWLTTLALENRELSEREQKHQEQMRQSQKMEAVGRLAGGIAHDFNNLLTVINGNSDMALRKLGDENPARRNIDKSKKAGEKAAELTGQLLAFSRKQSLEPVVLQLNSVITGFNTTLKQLIGEDVDLLIALDPLLGKVRADPGQLEQVLVNLVGNARDAMPQGGKLTIETANVCLEYPPTVNSVLPGSYVMLAVSDTGCGMVPETREQIFEPFYTTKDGGKGTGLGLSTVYGIVKHSGGSIWVYSEPDCGTVFKIYLPCVEVQAAEDFRRATPVDLPRGHETVLIVEDEELLRSTAREILQMTGYEVLEARHGKEALAITQSFDKPIHLMVTDVVMPEMTGPELASRLEKSSPNLKVLYMSGYTDRAIVHHGILDESAPFLEKPFSPDAFARKVREVLSAPEVRACMLVAD